MAKWLSIVGIGEDGLAGFGGGALDAVARAEFVFGGARHLELARPAIHGEARPWPSPFDAGITQVLALRGRRVCVLASGDPFWHGVGGTLARRISADEYAVFPAPSSFSLAAARLGWSLQEVETLSLHGRPIEFLRPLLHPLTKIIALTTDGEAPGRICRLMVDAGAGASCCQVLEALGGGNERMHSFRADEAPAAPFNPLNVMAIEVTVEPAAALPLGGGIGDDVFEHDGQITKVDVRAMTLAALAPLRGELLWDIGAGSGSIGISWMLTHPSLRAIAIEQRADRAQRVRANATGLGTPGLKVVEGRAPEALTGLPAPDAVFLGGGGSEPGVAEAAIAALKPGGRIVANAVTLEMEATLLALRARLGGDLVRLSIQRAEPVGGMSGWRLAMPVTRWRWVKPS
jgi:precorrin-6Y C5,15-methyltransferase (decarboxylating)